MTDDTPSLPSELDEGLVFAYGEDSAAPPSPSVLERIGEVTGSKPRVLLRDDRAGDTPMLKPLGPDDRLEAGKYVVQGELGRGGVGAVHRGHDQDLGRDVAMKFLHAKYKGNPAMLHRFVEEAQIGGQLQHPGIVPVYDLGMVDGKPFFSMKLVKGETLAKKLAERESHASDGHSFLTIFEDVCQTLAYAHARGVVHRDLKPANIMIGSFGEVQVVDWGMGKVLRTGGVADEKLASERQSELSVIETVRSAGHGTQSLVGSVMGTPAYMPPEQARGDVEAMDERSDVFALGAILCEILTGKPPYVSESNDLSELISMAAMAELEGAHARLEACGCEPEVIKLATRCLMPAPAARPRSAEAVAQAIQEHLAGIETRMHEARVEAAEAKVRTAALKRTQKLGVGLTVVIAAGLAASLWFWRAADTAAANEEVARLAAVVSQKEAQESEQRAVGQTELAERELARTLVVKELITDMLLSVSPETAQGADTQLLAGILDASSERLLGGTIQDESIAAELHGLIGRVYLNLGLYAKSEQHLPPAVEIGTRLHGEEHPATLGFMSNLAKLYLLQGHYTEAKQLSLKTLDLQRRVLGQEHPDTLSTFANLGPLYDSMGDRAAAESIMLETAEQTERVHGGEHTRTLSSWSNLASLYLFQGRYAESEKLFTKTLETQQRVLGNEHPATMETQSNIAQLYLQQGRLAEAESNLVETLETKRRVLGDEHPSTLRSMAVLSSVYGRQARYAEAESIFQQVLQVERRQLGEEHPQTIVTLANLANTRSKQGRYAEAEPLWLKAFALQKQVVGPESQTTLTTMNNLAEHYQLQGRYKEAEEIALEANEIQQRVLGDEHPNTISTLANLALYAASLGRNTEAEELYLEVLDLQARVLGEENVSTLSTLGNLAILYTRTQRFAEAVELYLETLDIKRRVMGSGHPNTLGTLTNLGLCYNSLGRFEEAVLALKASHAAKLRVLGLQHPWTGYAREGLIRAYVNLGRQEDAIPLLEERLLVVAGNPAATSAELNGAAWTLLTREGPNPGDTAKALKYAQRACDLGKASGDERLWMFLDTLAAAQHKSGDTATAIETQERALALVPQGADPEMAEQLANKLVEYEAAFGDR